MSTDATSPSATKQNANANSGVPSPDKGKGKSKFVEEVAVDDDDDDEDDEEEEEEEEDMDEDDDLGDIDPSAILPARRTRGVRVDYTSAAALAKAGLKPEGADEDEDEQSFEVRDEDMHDD